ncbi:MAG: LamG domain-containing protein [Myxococcota bacterium]
MRRTLILGAVLIAGCSLRDLSYLEGSDGGATHVGDYHAEVLRDQPVAYLRLGERSGTALIDEMGLQNSTYPASGVTLGAAGALLHDADTAITMDGSMGIVMPKGLDLEGLTPFTVELWARQTEQPNYGFTLDHEDFTGDRNGWGLLLASDEVSFERFMSGSTNGAVANSPGALSLNIYHHVVVTFDGAQLTLYIDNRVASLNAVGSEVPKTDNTWQIGHQNCACSGAGFIGDLDEIAFYPRAISAERVAAHFHASGR